MKSSPQDNRQRIHENFFSNILRCPFAIISAHKIAEKEKRVESKELKKKKKMGQGSKKVKKEKIRKRKIVDLSAWRIRISKHFYTMYLENPRIAHPIQLSTKHSLFFCISSTIDCSTKKKKKERKSPHRRTNPCSIFQFLLTYLFIYLFYFLSSLVKKKMKKRRRKIVCVSQLQKIENKKRDLSFSATQCLIYSIGETKLALIKTKEWITDERSF